MRKWILIVAVFVIAGVAMLVPVGGERAAEGHLRSRTRTMDLSSYSAEPPRSKLRLLFIHHSCGGQLLAPEGRDDGELCLYRTHPNGGGLRPKLEHEGYEVHEASYGSSVGEKTDLFDWLPKFRTQMNEILKVSRQDEHYPDDRRNQIVVFKSCFPNSAFVEEGSAPGNPAGPALTVANARATLTAVRGELAKQPGVLFVYLTAPPLAPTLPKQPLWRWLAKTVAGRQLSPDGLRRSGELARRFNDWVVDPGGWLAGYEHHNIGVFDYHRALTGDDSNLLRYPTGGGTDSHPAAAGNRRAADAFVPLLNRVVRRAGLSD